MRISPWPISPWPWFRTLYSGDRGSPSQACNLWISASADCLASVSSWRLTSSHSTNLRSPLQARLALLGVPQPLPGGRVIHSHSSPGSPHGGPDRAPRYGPATRRKRTRPRSIGLVLSHPPAARPRPGVKRQPTGLTPVFGHPGTAVIGIPPRPEPEPKLKKDKT